MTSVLNWPNLESIVLCIVGDLCFAYTKLDDNLNDPLFYKCNQKNTEVDFQQGGSYTKIDVIPSKLLRYSLKCYIFYLWRFNTDSNVDAIEKYNFVYDILPNTIYFL